MEKPLKKLFEDDLSETWTEEAAHISSEIHSALWPIFERLRKEGYKMREVAYIAMQEVSSLILTELAIKIREEYQQKQKNDRQK